MEEYKLMICHVTTLGGNIEKFEKICELVMCKNCEYWHRIRGTETYGDCDSHGTMTFENFACLDGTKKEE